MTSNNLMMAALPPAPGICGECHGSQGAIHESGLVVVHCHHNNVGAMININNRQLLWSAYGPLDREAFALTMTRILNGRVIVPSQSPGVH